MPQKLLAGPLLPPLARLPDKLLLHHRLGGNPGMVRAWHPQGLVPLHALPADEHVLQRVCEGMPHVQDPRHVRGGQDDRVRLLVGVGVRSKVASLLPEVVPLVLNSGGVVAGGHHFGLLGCHPLLDSACRHEGPAGGVVGTEVHCDHGQGIDSWHRAVEDRRPLPRRAFRVPCDPENSGNDRQHCSPDDRCGREGQACLGSREGTLRHRPRGAVRSRMWHGLHGHGPAAAHGQPGVRVPPSTVGGGGGGSRRGRGKGLGHCQPTGPLPHDEKRRHPHYGGQG
mmetsp:Transcript_4894/g.8934  ORF Transcript_4894/g.8934 Transcript_4894/m.8934 type:complete len:282 (-) Transcript_4894:66-911(-)